MLWKRPNINEKCSKMVGAIIDRQVELELLFEQLDEAMNTIDIQNASPELADNVDLPSIPPPLELAKLLSSLGCLEEAAASASEELNGLIKSHGMELSDPSDIITMNCSHTIKTDKQSDLWKAFLKTPRFEVGCAIAAATGLQLWAGQGWLWLAVNVIFLLFCVLPAMSCYVNLKHLFRMKFNPEYRRNEEGLDSVVSELYEMGECVQEVYDAIDNSDSDQLRKSSAKLSGKSVLRLASSSPKTS